LTGERLLLPEKKNQTNKQSATSAKVLLTRYIERDVISLCVPRAVAPGGATHTRLVVLGFCQADADLSAGAG
jgi:hypothetical protein